MRTYVRHDVEGLDPGPATEGAREAGSAGGSEPGRRAAEVPLPTAAEITLLLLEREPESYAPAARRLLARLAAERSMPLRQLVDVAAILAELEADPAMSAGGKLLALVKEAPAS